MMSSLVLFKLLALLLTTCVIVDGHVMKSDFEHHAETRSTDCYDCKNHIFPNTDAKSNYMFTCDHYKYVHSGCVASFFESLDDDKFCPHSECKHSPVVDPRMNFEFRDKFYNAYRTLISPTHDAPGKCTDCKKSLYGSDLASLRDEVIIVKECRNGHYFHTRCALPLEAKKCRCGASMFDYVVSLRGLMDQFAKEEFKRLQTFYEALTVADSSSYDSPTESEQHSRFPELSSFRYIANIQPSVTQDATYVAYRPKLPMHFPSIVLNDRLITGRNDEGDDTSGLEKQYKKDLLAIEKLDRENENDVSVPKCTICYNKIAGAYKQASTAYYEENSHENAQHLQNMHLVCAEYSLYFRPNCPMCRCSVFKRKIRSTIE